MIRVVFDSSPIPQFVLDDVASLSDYARERLPEKARIYLSRPVMFIRSGEFVRLTLHYPGPERAIAADVSLVEDEAEVLLRLRTTVDNCAYWCKCIDEYSAERQA